METRSAAHLIFNTSLDKKRLVRIPEPNPSINANVVDQAATSIISANPFDETIGSLVSLANAERVITNRIVLI